VDSWFTEEFARNFVYLSLLAFLALLGPYALTGRHKNAVMTVWFAALSFGCVCLGAGVVAFFIGQPRHVVWPLAWSGVVITAVFAGFYRTLRRAYQEAEIRKMTALDIG
jgi:hypothetical protein